MRILCSPLFVLLSLPLCVTGCDQEPEVQPKASVHWTATSQNCGGEACGEEIALECVVETIDEGTQIVLTLLCDDPDGGVATSEIIEIDFEPSATIDLDVGAAVSLFYRWSSGFEVGGSVVTRLLDDQGELVVAACEADFYGGHTGIDDAYRQAVETAFTPFSTDAEPLDAVYRLTLVKGGAKAQVDPGEVDHLVSDATWLVVSVDGYPFHAGVMRTRD